MSAKKGVLLMAALLGIGLSSLGLSGCSAEKGNPLGTQTLGGAPVGGDASVRDLDARGLVNGIYHPTDELGDPSYPIRYVGSWTLIPQNSQATKIYSAVSSKSGAYVNVVGSFTRAIIEFYDYKLYQNPGNVSFAVNGATVGSFDLARQDSSGNQIREYVVANPNLGKVATITVSVVQGNVMITGYWLVFP